MGSSTSTSEISATEFSSSLKLCVALNARSGGSQKRSVLCFLT